ncbi:hypothetical protein U1Q18_009456 [Sarracenia purpurea var. burkii]
MDQWIRSVCVEGWAFGAIDLVQKRWDSFAIWRFRGNQGRFSSYQLALLGSVSSLQSHDTIGRKIRSHIWTIFVRLEIESFAEAKIMERIWKLLSAESLVPVKEWNPLGNDSV